MLTYQAIIATRNDQGQLASMQNKLVRVALERLRLSIKEFVNDLPHTMEEAYTAAVAKDAAASNRIFLPTRPSLLNAGDSVRLFLVTTGVFSPAPISFYTRPFGESGWKTTPAIHIGRSVYSVTLGPFEANDRIISYYASVAANGSLITAPLEAPANAYWLNILDA